MEVGKRGELNQRSFTMRLGAMRPGWQMTIENTIDDWMEKFPLKGAWKTHLCCISLEICYQRCINGWNFVGMVGFEFKIIYKYGLFPNIQTLFFLRVYIQLFLLVLCLEMNSMSEPDWKELFSQPGLANILDFLRECFVASMIVNTLETEVVPFIPARFLTIAPRSPQPNPSISQPFASKATNKKQKKHQ